MNKKTIRMLREELELILTEPLKKAERRIKREKKLKEKAQKKNLQS